MSKRLQDKVALITGAGSMAEGWGNGKATAVLFAREGAKIFAVDRDLSSAEQTCEIIARDGGIAKPFAADVTNEHDIVKTVEDCISTYGAIDILHNNVGVLKAGGPEDTSIKDWEFVININMKAVFVPCKHVLPHMVKARQGSIINMSSISGFRNLGAPYIAYNTSKGSIVSFTRNLAATYAATNIRANSILPGIIDTPMAKDAVIQNSGEEASNLDFKEITKQRAQRIPMRRVGTAWDVAKAALFFASDDSDYITGTELIVDGGLNCVA